MERKGQACVALNTFGIYKQQKIPADPVGTIDHRTQHVVKQSVITLPVFGHSVELPSSFAGKPFTAELLDLSGRRLAVTKVDENQISTGTGLVSRNNHSGMYLVKCTSETDVAVRKFMNQ